MLITFEGGEGSGKSTQCQLLADYFNQNDTACIITREPGGTPHAESIRALLVEGDTHKWTAMSELLLYTAARIEHIEKTIKPALDAGTVVLCDRFIDSTIAYQGYGHGLGEELIKNLNHLVLGEMEPDITFILTLDVKTGITRATERHNAKDRAEDRYEHMDHSFHTRVAHGFQVIAQNHPERCHVIDAAQSIENISSILQEHVKKAILV